MRERQSHHIILPLFFLLVFFLSLAGTFDTAMANCAQFGCEPGATFTTQKKKAQKELEKKIGATAKSALTGKVSESKKGSTTYKIVKKINKVEKNWIPAFQAQATVFENAIKFLATSIGKFYDQKLRIKEDILRKKELAEINQQLSPPSGKLGCQMITAVSGALSGSFLRRAGEEDMNLRSSLSFENDSTTLYRYGSGPVKREMFDNWAENWCVDSANNGLTPENCGDSRDPSNRKKENLDIRLSDVLFEPTTWPDDEVLSAMKNIMFYLSVEPPEPFHKLSLQQSQTQLAFMKRRQQHARKNLADAVLNDLAMKRVPIIDNGEWLQEILGLNFSGDILGDSLETTISDIGDKVSYSQWIQIVAHDRFLGTDYLMRAYPMDETQIEEELNRLNALYLVQEREFYHLWEQFLALTAADYSQDLDNFYIDDPIREAN